MNIYELDDIPEILRDFLEYHSTVKGHSDKTVVAYYTDLKILLRYLKRRRRLVSADVPFNEIDITDVDIDFLKQTRLEELYSYPVYNFTPDIQMKIYSIFCDMLYEYEHYKKESDLILRGMLYNLIMTIIRFHQPSNPTDIELSKADTSILKAIKYMENNFLNDPSLTETAAYINFSPAHFSRLFKKVIGVSYSEYLNYIRVEMGRNLLLTTNLSIGEIAQLSGFNNSNYFCNVMKKILGDNPSKIRRLK